MIVQFRNEKVSNHGSIPITIDCNVVAFNVFEEGFHQPIKRTKQSVFLDTLPWQARSPDLSPVEDAWDQLKRQMPSCHSVHDLELAIQDLWAHLPQDNIRCLINSMLDHVVACIAAGGGPTRY
ncbi:transposable element Tcb2 transposase [Trichonephila clavipes]|nr:transposable element Tcb2 transposase [Trichonephila clavipes]